MSDEAANIIIARYAFDFLRELGFRHDPIRDAYVYERSRSLSRTEVIDAMRRAE